MEAKKGKMVQESLPMAQELPVGRVKSLSVVLVLATFFRNVSLNLKLINRMGISSAPETWHKEAKCTLKEPPGAALQENLANGISDKIVP
jgi:hypothetical protein